MPTAKPTLRVLVIAWLKDGMAKIRVKTSKVTPLSETTESTIRMASGYKIKRVKNDNGRYQNWIAKELLSLKLSALGFCHAGPNSETLNLYAKLYVELGRQISAYPV